MRPEQQVLFEHFGNLFTVILTQNRNVVKYVFNFPLEVHSTITNGHKRITYFKGKIVKFSLCLTKHHVTKTYLLLN
jgi:hypothetical protein